MDYKLFRQNLRTLRASRNLSGIKLSEALQMKSPKRILDLEERDSMLPSIHEVTEIAKFFNVSIDDLLFKKAAVKVEFVGEVLRKSKFQERLEEAINKTKV